MAADKIQVDYQRLTGVSRQFCDNADEVEEVYKAIQAHVEQLRSSGWEGRAASAFFREMEDVVFPGMTRLQSSMGDAAELTMQLVELFSQAEAEATQHFRGEGAGGPGGGIGTGGRRGIGLPPPGFDILPVQPGAGGDFWGWIKDGFHRFVGFDDFLDAVGETRISEGILKFLGLGKAVPVAGYLLGVADDFISDQDPDRVRAMVSSLISNGIAEIPGVDIVSGANDIVQFVGGVALDKMDGWNAMLAARPDLIRTTAEMEEATNNVRIALDRADLNHFFKDVGRFGSDIMFGGRDPWAAMNNFLQNPSDANAKELLTIGSYMFQAASSNHDQWGINAAENFFKDPIFRDRMMQDSTALVVDGVNVVAGGTDLLLQGSKYIANRAIAEVTLGVQDIPGIPDSWKRGVKDIAAGLQDHINDIQLPLIEFLPRPRAY